MQHLVATSLLLDALPATPLAVCGLVLALAGIGLVHANACWKLRRETRRRRQLQRRMDDVAGTLPVVVFQARRMRDGQVELDWLAGDTPQLFSASVAELQANPGAILAAIPAAERVRVLSALVRSVRHLCPVSLRFSARGVRGLRKVAMHAWPALQASNGQRWSGYWMDVSDADLREQAILRTHAQATADAAARLQLVSALGKGIGVPMQVLLQRLTQLRVGPLDGHQRVALAALEDAASMLSRILADVLEASVENEPGMALHATQVDLRGLLASMETLLRPVALSKGLDLRYQVDSGVADALLADETRLRQILFNLVGNAIKFTVHGGVSIVVQPLDETARGQRLRIDVVDTGVGIAPEQQERVFEPFAQAASSAPGDHRGTGLGLGICRHLVRAMGGNLTLHSAVGQGTVVTVELELPRAATPPMTRVDACAAADAMGDVGLDPLLIRPISQHALHEANEQVAPGLLAAQRPRAIPPCNGHEEDTPSMAMLVARFGGDGVAGELVHTLRVSLEEDLLALQGDWASGADAAAAQRLHRMAGGVGSLGLVALATHLRELNEAAVPSSAEQRRALQARLQRCIAHLQTLET